MSVLSCDPLQPLFNHISSCKSFMSGGVCRIHHVFRKSNCAVDMLASIGIIKLFDSSYLESPLVLVNPLIFNDLYMIFIFKFVVG